MKQSVKLSDEGSILFMNTNFIPFPENIPSSEQHTVLVKVRQDAPLRNLLGDQPHYEVETWDGKFFIADPFTGLCAKYDSGVENGIDVTDQVFMFSKI